MRKSQGFTLIELMVTVAIVAVLAAIAYPSYMNQVRRSNRTDARNALLQVQVAEEKYFLSGNTNSYGTLAQLNAPTILSGLRISGSTYQSANGYYTITVTPATPTTTYTATAVPVSGSAQVSDTHCAQFQITSTGDRSGTTNADCWTR